MAVIVFWGAASFAIAQGGSVPAVGEFFERYSPAAEISGTPVMGLVTLGESVPGLHQIVARIPADWVGEVFCARVVSSDGRYEAEQEFSVPKDWVSGTAALNFPTRYGDELARFTPTEMGVMVTSGECGVVSADQRITPAAWNAKTLSGGAVLLVNSFRAEETYLIVADRNLDITCAPLPLDRRTAFDTMCALPADFLAGGGLVSVELNRVRRGALEPGEVFAIDLR